MNAIEKILLGRPVSFYAYDHYKGFSDDLKLFYRVTEVADKNITVTLDKIIYGEGLSTYGFTDQRPRLFVACKEEIEDVTRMNIRKKVRTYLYPKKQRLNITIEWGIN